MLNLLWLILCIGFVLIIHSLAHLIAARIFGVRVQEFSLFWAPWFSIIRWKPGKYIKFFVSSAKAQILEKENEEDDLANYDNISPKSWRDTEYVLGWIPIAGHCTFDTRYERRVEDQPVVYPNWDIRNFNPWKQLIVISAGIVANIILALAIVICLNLNSSAQLDEYCQITSENVRQNHLDQKERLSDGVPIESSITETEDYYNNGLKRGMDSVKSEHNSVKESFTLTTGIAKQIFTSFLFSNEERTVKADQNSNADFHHNQDENVDVLRAQNNTTKALNWERWWFVVANLSMFVAILNLFPFKGLDGGPILFCLLQIILRRRLNENVMAMINLVGILLLLGWFIWFNFKDLFNFL